MQGERLVGLLTEIRDQQKRQIENFERAVMAQIEYAELHRKGRRLFLFMLYAPWVALAIVLVRSFVDFS